MHTKSGSKSVEDIVINFLKKNKNFFIKNPELINELNFPIKDKSQDKIIDLGAYRYKRISRENSYSFIFLCGFHRNICISVAFCIGKYIWKSICSLYNHCFFWNLGVIRSFKSCI